MVGVNRHAVKFGIGVVFEGDFDAVVNVVHKPLGTAEDAVASLMNRHEGFVGESRIAVELREFLKRHRGNLNPHTATAGDVRPAVNALA